MRKHRVTPAEVVAVLDGHLRALEAEERLHEDRQHAEYPAWVYGQG